MSHCSHHCTVGYVGCCGLGWEQQWSICKGVFRFIFLHLGTAEIHGMKEILVRCKRFAKGCILVGLAKKDQRASALSKKLLTKMAVLHKATECHYLHFYLTVSKQLLPQ